MQTVYDGLYRVSRDRGHHAGHGRYVDRCAVFYSGGTPDGGQWRRIIPDAGAGSYTGTPHFIVETLSPATALKDRTIKKEIYQKAGIAEYWIISPKERAVEVYYLENGEYDLKYSYVLQDDPEEKHYNADTVVTLREFPNISMTLADMFENIE